MASGRDYFQDLLQQDSKAPGQTSADVITPIQPLPEISRATLPTEAVPQPEQQPAAQPQPQQAAPQMAQPDAQQVPAQPAPEQQPADPFNQLVNDAQKSSSKMAGALGTPDVTQGQGSLNDPLNVAPESLSILDRAKLKGLGNEKGMTNFLKNKFEDVSVDPEKGILVKEKGLWHRMDPSGLGQYFSDPWKASKSLLDYAKTAGKEVLSDVADNTDAAINLGANAATVGASTAAGAAAGSVIPGVGTAVGAGVGFLGGLAAAGAASGLIRTSLGKILGTYDATPEEQFQEIGWEAFINMGLGAIMPTAGTKGFTTALRSEIEGAVNPAARAMATSGVIKAGEKPTIDQLTTAAKNLNQEAPGVTKKIIAKYLGLSTKAGEDGIQTIMSNPDEFGAAFKDAAEKAAENNATLGLGKKATTQAMQQAAGVVKIDSGKQILENGVEKLTSDFGKNFEALVASAPEDFKIDPIKLGGTVGKSLNDTGLGQLVQKGGAYRFIPISAKQLGPNLDKAAATEYLTDSEAKTVQQLVNQVSPLLKTEVNTAQGSVRLLQLLNKQINRFDQQIPLSQQSAAFQRIVGQVRTAFKNGISEQLADTPLQEGWTNMLRDYTSKVNAVNWARDILESADKASIPTRLQSVVDQAFNPNGEKNPLVKQYLTDLVKLGGKDSQEQFLNMRVYDAVQKFSPMASKFSLGTATKGAAVGAAAVALPVLHNPLVAIPAAAITAPAFLPRTSARIAQGIGYGAQKIGAGTSAIQDAAVQYGMKALDTIKSLSVEQMRQLINNPQALETLFQTPAAAKQGEDQQTLDLLQKTGAIPPQQGGQ